MNQDRLEGKWTTLKGKVRESWGKLTDDDMDRIAGKEDQLIGAIQERYGEAKEEASRQVRQFLDLYLDTDAPHAGAVTK